MQRDEYPKYRHELKYLVSSAEIAILRARIQGLMKIDPHAISGQYAIRSLYFDDQYNRCYYENENGHDPRAKYRIRIYNHQDSVIHLERKHKERNKTRKLSCELTRDLADQLISGEMGNPSACPQLVQELIADMLGNRMHPVIIVDYDRIPYVYPLGNVRVTFDTSISSSKELHRFFEETITKRPVLPPGMQLMEVKFDEYLPDVIHRALQLNTLQQTTFSKYYLCRKYSM